MPCLLNRGFHLAMIVPVHRVDVFFGMIILSLKKKKLLLMKSNLNCDFYKENVNGIFLQQFQ